MTPRPAPARRRWRSSRERSYPYDAGVTVRVRMAPSPTGFLHVGRRPDLPVQLALRAPAGRRVPPPDREHRHEPRGRRRHRADPGVAPLARDRLGRPGHLPARPDGRGAHLRGAARRGGQGVCRRGRDPLPDARRGRRRLGGRRPRADRVPEREPRRPRDRPLRRSRDLQLRLAGRGHARRDHARDPRQRPRLEHADADQHPHGARRDAPRVRAPART